MRALLVGLAILLAGCLSGPPSSGNGEHADLVASAPALNQSLDNQTRPAAVTDTLYLLKAPALNTTLPENETVIATKGPYNAQTFVWNRTANSTGNVSGGHLRIWLLLPHSAAQQGAANDPGCTVHWLLVVNWNGTQRTMDGGCGSLGLGPVPPGEYAFNITAPPPAAPLEFGPGANVRIQVTVGLVQPNGGAAYLMGGTAHYDSHLKLNGLAEQVDLEDSSGLPAVAPTGMR